MDKFCIFCGEKLDENGNCKNNHEYKAMCLNCAHVINVDGNLCCGNEKNLETVKNKMLEAAKSVSNGYDVTNLEIKPLPLKAPNKKCGEWVLNDAVLDLIKGMFK